MIEVEAQPIGSRKRSIASFKQHRNLLKVAVMAKARIESSKGQQKKALNTFQGAVSSARTVAWKLAKSTGRAGWITATCCLVLLVPLIIEMDREQQLVEFENQQLGALTGGSTTK